LIWRLHPFYQTAQNIEHILFITIMFEAEEARYQVASFASAPETSDHTSIKERIKPAFDLAEAIARQTEQQALNDFSVPLKPLLGFEGIIRNGFQRGILFSFEDYLELVDCTGRISRDDKRGAIDENALPILERLNLDPERWCHRAMAFEDSYQDYRNPGRRRVA